MRAFGENRLGGACESDRLSYADAVRVAERYIGAYTERDLDAMLAVQDENVVSYPAPLFGHRPHHGHDGVRAWWSAMADSRERYDVAIREIRLLEPDRVAVIGEIRDRAGIHLSPWSVVVRVRNGLIVESRSYLSEVTDLERLGVLGEPPAQAPDVGA